MIWRGPTIMVATLILAGCSQGAAGQPVSKSESQANSLIQTACSRLPNLMTWASWGDVRKPWKDSLTAFGSLARLDTRYLGVSTAAQKVANTVEPLSDDLPEINVVNGFCSGIGTLTP